MTSCSIGVAQDDVTGIGLLGYSEVAQHGRSHNVDIFASLLITVETADNVKSSTEFENSLRDVVVHVLQPGEEKLASCWRPDLSVIRGR
eukprot:scaffold22737_cov120-Cylindrotheca_fusiformis.AAC.4